MTKNVDWAKANSEWQVDADGIRNARAGVSFRRENLGISQGGLPVLPGLIADTKRLCAFKFLAAYEHAIRCGFINEKAFRPDWRAAVQRELIAKRSRHDGVYAKHGARFETELPFYVRNPWRMPRRLMSFR